MHYTIANGEKMAVTLPLTRPDCHDVIPINERMDEGNPNEDLFSGMFIVERLSALHTNITLYLDSVLKYLDPFREPENQNNTFHFYLEESPTAYANLLTWLAYLDRANYKKPVEVTFVSPDFSHDLRSMTVQTTKLYSQYKEYCRKKDPEAIRALFQ